jgi:di/tricarboxylate transporter
VSDIQMLFVIVGATIALFVWNRLPLVVVAMGCALSLWFTGILTLPEVFRGFGDPVAIFVASLFIVTAGLEATGVTAWISQQFERIVAGDPDRLLLLGMLVVAALCPFVNASGAVGALMPVVMLMVVRLQEQPSRFLMPMAFASSGGSHLALTGAPKNVLITDAAADFAGHDLNFFAFALAGIPLLAGTVLIVWLFGRRLVPVRAAPSLPRDLSRHARTLVQQYRLAEDVFVLVPRVASPLLGADVSALPLGEGLRLVMVSAASGKPRLEGGLHPGDRLVLRGSADAAGRFAELQGLGVAEMRDDDAAGKLINPKAGVAEVVIPQRSRLIGLEVCPGMVTQAGDVVVIAIQRRGEDMLGRVILAPGDHLLVLGTWAALRMREGAADVLVVDRPETLRRQLVPLGKGARSVLAIVAAMVAAIASGAMPPAVATVLAAGAIMVLRLVSVDDAFRAVNWTTVVLIAAMFPLSTALVDTGAAELAAHRVVAAVGAGSPHLLLALVFLLAAGMGAVLSNTATTMILLPITVSAADAFGISALPVLMCLSVATSASFLTPVSTTANTMVMGPAGYRFSDYWRLGLPLTAWYMVVGVFLVPLIWPF